MYRWRRGLIAVLVVVLAAAGALISQENPIQRAQIAWFTFRKDYDSIDGVTAAVVPARAAVKGSDPAALVDQRFQEWTMTWNPKKDGICAGAPETGAIVLTFPVTRVDKIQIRGGLAPGNRDRTLEPRPKIIGVTFPEETPDGVIYPDRLCIPATVNDDSQLATDIPLDSHGPVTSVRVTVNSVYPGAKPEKRVSFTEITLKKLPVR